MYFSEESRVSHYEIPSIKKAKYCGDGIFLVAFSNDTIAVCDAGSKWGKTKIAQKMLNSQNVNNYYLVPNKLYSADTYPVNR